MRRLAKKDLQEIKIWVYRNARPIDLAIWQYYFERGSKEAVLAALSLYQNEDGGFGHALEADSWNPNSSPYPTVIAINILKGIDFEDTQHPIMKGIFKFLESGSFCSEAGWYFNIPSNNDYPHAPWWTYDMEANTIEGIGITAEIVGFLLKYADVESTLYQKAMSFAEALISRLTSSENFGDMGIGGYCVLLESIEQANLVQHFNCTLLADRLTVLVRDSIVRDTSRWESYCVRPSEYISSPDNIFYMENKDIVEKELDYLIDTRPGNGVWDITWSWFDNNEIYAKEFAISENWWKTSKAIEKILFLKNFSRLEKQ